MRVELTNSQSCPVTGPEAMSTNWTMKIMFKHKKKTFFTVKVIEQWNGLTRGLVESPSLKILRTQMETVNCCGWPCPSRAWMHCSLDVSYTGTTASLPHFEGLVESRKLSCSLQSFMIFFLFYFSLLTPLIHFWWVFLISKLQFYEQVGWASLWLKIMAGLCLQYLMFLLGLKGSGIL